MLGMIDGVLQERGVANPRRGFPYMYIIHRKLNKHDFSFCLVFNFYKVLSILGGKKHILNPHKCLVYFFERRLFVSERRLFVSERRLILTSRLLKTILEKTS